MPIDMPSTRPSRTNTRISDHVRCGDFVFRVADVDAFSHQPMPESAPVTVVNFRGYSQAIPDPDRELFAFLVAQLQPKPVDEMA